MNMLYGMVLSIDNARDGSHGDKVRSIPGLLCFVCILYFDYVKHAKVPFSTICSAHLVVISGANLILFSIFSLSFSFFPSLSLSLVCCIIYMHFSVTFLSLPCTWMFRVC